MIYPLRLMRYSSALSGRCLDGQYLDGERQGQGQIILSNHQSAWETIALGHSVVIFPEGTRVAPDELKRFGVGGAMLAARTGMPVVPIAHNAGCFWGRKQLHKRPGMIDVVIGPPIETKGLSASAINALAEDWIRATAATLTQDADRSAVSD